MGLVLGEVIDTIRRRARFLIKEDPIEKIYARFNNSESEVKIFIILNKDLPAYELVSLATRYIHLFDDMSSMYTFEMLNKTNHFKSTSTTYLIWRKGSGFLWHDLSHCLYNKGGENDVQNSIISAYGGSW